MCGLKWYTDGKCDHTGLPSDGPKLLLFLLFRRFLPLNPDLQSMGVASSPRGANTFARIYRAPLSNRTEYYKDPIAFYVNF